MTNVQRNMNAIRRNEYHFLLLNVKIHIEKLIDLGFLALWLQLLMPCQRTLHQTGELNLEE